MLLALAEMPELEMHTGLNMRDRVTALTDFGEESEIGRRARVRLSVLHKGM
jgi:hypothetical protein